MEYDAVVISCGAAKIETDKPVQAWRLYTGGYYKIMLNLAIRMSKNVYILSAGYGLLRLNDMVETYDLKMDKKRAKQFKKLNLMQLTEYESKSLIKFEQSIIEGKFTNDGMVQLIKLIEDYLNPLSIQEFADRNNISYQAARKHKQVILFRQKFIIDND